MSAEFGNKINQFEIERAKQRETQTKLLYYNANRVGQNLAAFHSLPKYDTLQRNRRRLDIAFTDLSAEDSAQLITETFIQILMGYPESVDKLFVGYQGIFNKSFDTQDPPVYPHLDRTVKSYAEYYERIVLAIPKISLTHQRMPSSYKSLVSAARKVGANFSKY